MREFYYLYIRISCSQKWPDPAFTDTVIRLCPPAACAPLRHKAYVLCAARAQTVVTHTRLTCDKPAAISYPYEEISYIISSKAG